MLLYIKAKWSRYRPGVAQRVGRDIALFFHDRGTRGWVVSSTPRPHLSPEKDPVPIVQETGWAPGPVWTDGKSRPHRDSILDRPARSQSLYRLSYRPTMLLYNLYLIPDLRAFNIFSPVLSDASDPSFPKIRAKHITHNLSCPSSQWQKGKSVSDFFLISPDPQILGYWNVLRGWMTGVLLPIDRVIRHPLSCQTFIRKPPHAPTITSKADHSCPI